jgi:hypothetical protein
MSFEISHTNSAGTVERQTVAEGDVLSLISKIGRLGGSDILVTGAGGLKWTAEEAELELKEQPRS